MTDDSTNDIAELETQYENRNETLQHAIDVLSQYEQTELEQFGKKAEVAREHDIEQHQIHYVLNNWNELVNWRRNANRNPLDPDAVKQAYEDETLQAMAGNNQAVADGAGDIQVQIELSLDEVFRAIKLLPGDLGLKVYSQVLSSDFDRSVVRRLLEGE